MHVPTVGDVLNQSHCVDPISDEHVHATCFCCGIAAPLSSAVRLEKSGALFYRCATCEEPVAMVSRPVGLRDSVESPEGAWAFYPLATMEIGRA